MKHFVCLWYVVLSSLLCYAQIDSLKKVIASAKEDTSKVNTLIELSVKYRNSSTDTAIKYAFAAKKLSLKLGYPKGLAYSLKAVGMVYNLQGEYVDAIQLWKEALAIFEKNGIKVGSSNMYNNIGAVYNQKSMEDSAQDYFLKSQKIAEEIKDTLRIATALMNIGAIYSGKEATYGKSVAIYRKALLFSEAIHASEAIGTCFVNIGELYLKKSTHLDTLESLKIKDLDSALICLFKSRENYIGSSNLPYALNLIGTVYLQKGEFDLSIDYHKQAFDTGKIFDSKLDMAQALLGIAQTLKEKKDSKASIDNYLQAEIIFKEIGFDETYDIEKVYEGLSSCYAMNHDFDNAFKFQTKLLEVRKQIYDLEVDKKLGTKLFAFDLEKKQGEINLQHEAIQRQKLIRNVLIFGFAIVLLFASVFFIQRNKITKGKKLSDELLLNILPEEVAEELKAKGSADAKLFDEVTVLFTDFKGFTSMAEQLTPKELVRDIHECFSAFDLIMEKYGMEKIKTIGDSYMAVGGLPSPNTTHASDTISAALEIRAFIAEGKSRKIAIGKPFFEIRIGVHTGPVVAGIVGVKKFAYDIWGDTVNTASRMESSGEVGKINISGSTYRLIKDLPSATSSLSNGQSTKFSCIYRGKIEAKNKGDIDMYFVES